MQLVAAQLSALDAVLFTHEHADHIHGIDDLRAFTMRRSTPLPLYADPTTASTLRARFPYIVDRTMRPVAGTSKPEGHLVTITAGVPFTVGRTTVLPIEVPHGHHPVLGFRIGDVGYLTDAKTVPPAARDALAGVRVLILNALWRRPHPTHLSIEEAVAVAQDIGAEATWLTHLTHDHAHAELAASLPSGIAPGFDGLDVIVDADGVRPSPEPHWHRET